MGRLNVAWWNLENLFDHERAVRDPRLKRTLANELKGWSAAVRDRKIAQLASIIRMMFDGEGPALLGLCEIENETVVTLLAEAIALPNRNYKVVSHESTDVRGVDTSFIIDANQLTVLNTDHQMVNKRRATRDIFWARLRIDQTGAEFIAIANHWPARSAGQYQSEPFRMLTGETHSLVTSRMLDKNEGGEAHLPILSMGDYNDEPFNRSLQEYLRCSRDPGRVRYSKSGHMLNLMWPLMTGHDPGTYLYNGNWGMLDQFLVSYGLMRGASPVRVDQQSVAIFRPDIIRGSSGKPRRFYRPSAKRGMDRDGYSDHFPILVQLLV